MLLSEFSKEQLDEAVSKSKTYTEILKNLAVTNSGAKYYSLKNVLRSNNIDLIDFEIRRLAHLKTLKVKRDALPYKEILVENSQYSSSALRKRLVRDGLIENKCSKCGLEGIWNNEPITLHLDHINGKHNDNRLENLRILCPNCHSQTSNFAGKKDYRKYFCSNCSKQIHKTNKSGLCMSCVKVGNKWANGKNRRVDRPSKEIILDLIEKNGYSAVGRMYGVSDNAVRKWLK